MARRRTRKRGGMSADEENKFLKEQAEKRKKELDVLGEKSRVPAQIIESLGKETRKPVVSTQQIYQTERARSESAGKRSRRKRYTRRRK